MNTKTLLTALTALTASVAAISANAATITGVTIEDFSSDLKEGFADRLAVYTIDGSGFEPNGTGTHSTDAEGNMWMNTGTFTTGGNPGDDPLPSTITYDLEGNYDLDAFTVWNYNGGTGTGGANGVTVSVADTVGGPFTTLAGITNFAQAPGNDTTDFGETFDLTSLSAANNVRLLRIEITSNHGSGEDLAGLSEIRFDGTVVPEPGSLALLGLGGLLIARRRRA